MSTLQATLMAELGLEKLSDQAQKETLLKMTELVLKRILLTTFEHLKDDEVDELIALQEKGAEQEEVHNFLKRKIQNYEDLLQKTIAEFKNDMKLMLGQLQEVSQ